MMRQADVEALGQLLPTYARVVRDGKEIKILAEELVLGDLIILAEGDRRLRAICDPGTVTAQAFADQTQELGALTQALSPLQPRDNGNGSSDSGSSSDSGCSGSDGGGGCGGCGGGGD